MGHKAPSLLVEAASAQKIGSFQGAFLSNKSTRLAPLVIFPRVQAAIKPAGPAPQTTASYSFERKSDISRSKLAFIYLVFLLIYVFFENF
jgi:hypothetical protein